MGDKTGISWCDATWNPVRGCSRVSEGCRHCYAERVAARFCDEGQPYHGLARRKLTIVNNDEHDPGNKREARWTGEVRLIPEHLADPLRWKKPRRIFVNSMSDLFHEKLTNEQIAAVFGVMAAAPQHTFQVLTKRAKRMREWFEWVASNTSNNLEVTDLLASCAAIALADTEWRGDLARGLDWWKQAILDFVSGLKPRASWEVNPAPWPLPNVWLGVSVENQAAADERIPELLRTPAAVRFLSCEPLLGPVDLKGWGDHAPTDVDDPPETWDGFAWPEWVPEEQRRHIESFWGASSGRSPRAWLRDHAIQQVPATGARVTCAVSKDGWATVNKMATSGVTGRYLHSWNNIGRIITDDGQVVCASGGSGSGWLSRWLDKDGEYRSRLHWVIAGCESGPGSRPCSVEWLRSLRDQCAAAGVPYFLKQAEESVDDDNLDGTLDAPVECMPEGAPVVSVSKRKGRGPGGNQIIELPHLDGVQHAAFPGGDNA